MPPQILTKEGDETTCLKTLKNIRLSWGITLPQDRRLFNLRSRPSTAWTFPSKGLADVLERDRCCSRPYHSCRNWKYSLRSSSKLFVLEFYLLITVVFFDAPLNNLSDIYNISNSYYTRTSLPGCWAERSRPLTMDCPKVRWCSSKVRSMRPRG